MRKSYRFLTSLFIAATFTLTAFAQKISLSGNVRNNTTTEAVPAVSVIVKGSTLGTFTDDKGNFTIAVPKLPVTLVFSSTGYVQQELQVTSASQTISVNFVPFTQLGEEVVVAATRSSQRSLESPVTVERMSSANIKNIPGPSYYEAIANLKGVDMHTASLTFRTVTTRGFVSSGNLRLNQLIDGMDNQAPGLNFSVGNIVGLTELDVDNLELLSGASSALYGSGGMNGTLLINSKNPFKYQGLSFNIKNGVNHIDGDHGKISPYYDWGFRFAKAWKNKFAFKIGAQLVKALDWQADDYRNVVRNNVISKLVGGDRSSDPNYDGVNVYGDQISANLFLVGAGVNQTIVQQFLAATGINLVNAANGQVPGIAPLPVLPTSAQMDAFASQFGPGKPTVLTWEPYYTALRNNWYPNQNVSRTGYEEKYIVDYNTLNVKGIIGFNYKINSDLEVSWNSYLGTGTTVYTGADRYSLRNFKMAQHKLELRSSNWFVRGYTTQENAGESYNATAVASLINETWSPSSTVWYPTYAAAYSEYYRNLYLTNVAPNSYNAHLFARSNADAKRILPGTTRFDKVKDSVRRIPIPNGGLFLDKTDMWAGEAQLNLSDQFKFSKYVEVIVGGNWKQYILNSNGTLFIDHTVYNPSVIKLQEYGGYMQLKKSFIHNIFTVTAAGRYDDHTNFDGRFTPRVTLTTRVAKNNYLRLSYQTAYRFPSNQDQYIFLNTGTAYLAPYDIGFLDASIHILTNPIYTAESIGAYRSSVSLTRPLGDSSLLVSTLPGKVKPESTTSYEIGYKGVLMKKLLIDVYAYKSTYQDFLGRVAVGQSKTGKKADLLNPFNTTNVSYIQNSPQKVKAIGWGLGLEYTLPRGFVAYGNIYSDDLQDLPEGYVAYFNAPEYRWNLGLRNENVYKNIGMNVVVKWQDNVYYEGTFATGTLPYFTWVDAQVTYKLPKTKSVFKLGGTNIGNTYARTGMGSPYVGGVYYLSYGYNL